jgi:SprT-like family
MRQVFTNADSPSWLGQGEAEFAIRRLAEGLDADFFGSRLRVADSVQLKWLAPGSGADGTCDPYRRIIRIDPNMLVNPCRRGLCVVLLHELCHLGTRNELTDHGPRWQKEMRRCGLDPMGGALAHNSPLDQWIATRMRGWLQ